MKNITEPFASLFQAYKLASLLAEKQSYIRIVQSKAFQASSTTIYNVQNHREHLRTYEVKICQWINNELTWCNAWEMKDV